MRLEIGHRSYDFQISRGPLRLGGRRRAAVCDHRKRRILVSAKVPGEVRAEVAALSVAEAWKRQMIQRPPIEFVGDVS